MSKDFNHAMILGAGFGTRMAPLTDTTPKPLVPLNGKALIDWSIDRFQENGITELVVNTHYLSHLMEAHFANQPNITLHYEAIIQETGGGVRDALPLLGDAPFFVANSDAVWLDGAEPAIQRMRQAWDENWMDALLLMVPVAGAYGYDGLGDYYILPDQQARHRGDRLVAPYLFGGLQILAPSLFEKAPNGPFTLRKLYDQAEKSKRLYGIAHDGEWYHVGTVDALREVEIAIMSGYSKVNTR